MLVKNCRIMKGAAKIASIKTKTLLDLNMILSKSFTCCLKTFEPFLVARELAHAIEQQMSRQQVRIDIKYDELVVLADLGRVEQVLLSLLSQATHCSVKHGTVEVCFNVGSGGTEGAIKLE